MYFSMFTCAMIVVHVRSNTGVWHGEFIVFKSVFAGSNICTLRTNKFRIGISWRNIYLSLIHKHRDVDPNPDSFGTLDPDPDPDPGV